MGKEGNGWEKKRGKRESKGERGKETGKEGNQRGMREINGERGE